MTYLLEPKCPYDMGTLNICMGILAGLVSITGCCDRIEPWAAFVNNLFIIHIKLIFRCVVASA